MEMRRKEQSRSGINRGLFANFQFPSSTSHLDIPKENEIDLKGYRLQVIVKIGSVELTPENPEFPDGNWHRGGSSIHSRKRHTTMMSKGMANEKIVATAIFYFDSENIEYDSLWFRQGGYLVSNESDRTYSPYLIVIL